MKDTQIGSTLRELREKSTLSIKDVVSKLEKLGINISDKTLYSYESGKRAANADMFLSLCQIYGCNNILEVFSNIEIDYSVPNDTEWKIIEKYRSLDNHGKDLIDTIINMESERVKLNSDNVDKIIELVSGNDKVILRADELKAALEDPSYAYALNFAKELRQEESERVFNAARELEKKSGTR